MEKVNNENADDLFHEIAEEVEDEWGMCGLSGDFYEEYARAIFNRYIDRLTA